MDEDKGIKSYRGLFCISYIMCFILLFSVPSMPANVSKQAIKLMVFCLAFPLGLIFCPRNGKPQAIDYMMLGLSLFFVFFFV